MNKEANIIKDAHKRLAEYYEFMQLEDTLWKTRQELASMAERAKRNSSVIPNCSPSSLPDGSTSCATVEQYASHPDCPARPVRSLKDED